MQEAIASKGQMVKSIIDIVVAQNVGILEDRKNSLISELEQQEKVMKGHITSLQNTLDEYEKYISTNQRAHCILMQNENLIKNPKTPNLTEISLPSFTESQLTKEAIAIMFGKIQESTKTTVQRRVTDLQAAQNNDAAEKLIPIATRMKNFASPGVEYSYHISPVTSDEAWVSDFSGNLVLTNIMGEKLNEVEYAESRFGCHTTTDTGDLIFLNKKQNGIYKLAVNSEDSTLITKVPLRKVRTIFSSPLNGDILVGTRNPGNKHAKIVRYNVTGQKLHDIPHLVTEDLLFGDPHYITENSINGDVCVSDYDKHAVVVVDRDRNYRFTYTGHPPKSDLLPHGICTDMQGNILVSDGKSHSVQMTDKDGNFLSFLLTSDQEIQHPTGLYLDVRNNILWVGERWKNTVSVYRYNPQK